MVQYTQLILTPSPSLNCGNAAQEQLCCYVYNCRTYQWSCERYIYRERERIKSTWKNIQKVKTSWKLAKTLRDILSEMNQQCGLEFLNIYSVCKFKIAYKTKICSVFSWLHCADQLGSQYNFFCRIFVTPFLVEVLNLAYWIC